MNHRPKCKTSKQAKKKKKKEKITENLSNLGIRAGFLATTPKTWSIKKKVDELSFNNVFLKTSALLKALLREWKDKS